ncbi:unnamed protein product, partial [Prorocentrum cordatum]
AAGHAAQAPAEGFARASAAAIAEAAAGPRLLAFAGSGGSPKAEAEQPFAEDTDIEHGKFDLADVGIGVSDSTVTREVEDVGEEIADEIDVEEGVGYLPSLITAAPQCDNDDFQFGKLELPAVQRIAWLPNLEGRLHDDFGIQLETRAQSADESDYGIDEAPKDVGLDMDEERASIGPSEVSRCAAVHDDYAALAEAFKAKAVHDDFDDVECGEHVDVGTLHLLHGSDTPLVEAMLEQGLIGCHVNEIMGAGAVGASLAEDLVGFAWGRTRSRRSWPRSQPTSSTQESRRVQRQPRRLDEVRGGVHRGCIGPTLRARSVGPCRALEPRV